MHYKFLVNFFKRLILLFVIVMLKSIIKLRKKKIVYLLRLLAGLLDGMLCFIGTCCIDGSSSLNRTPINPSTENTRMNHPTKAMLLLAALTEIYIANPMITAMETKLIANSHLSCFIFKTLFAW